MKKFKKKPCEGTFGQVGLPFYSLTGLFALLLFWSTACETNDGDELPQEIKVTMQPRDLEINQGGLVKITATVSPKVSSPLTYQWGSSAKYGTINKESPFYLFTEETTSGHSSVDYMANIISNPGGTDQIIVTVYNQANVAVSVDTVAVSVKPHDPQMVHGVMYEYVTEGTIPGRQNILFLKAWVFDIKPGFTRYKFTVKQPAGEGWDVGPVGTTSIHSLSGTLADRDRFVNAYGSDIFDLKDTKIALLGAGPSFNNFDPANSNHVESLDNMRRHATNGVITVYEVEPAI